MRIPQFTNPFKTENESEFLAKAIEEKRPKSYYSKNIRFKKNLHYGSYFFAIISLVGAASGLYLMFDFGFGSPAIAVAVALPILLIIEYVKRYSSNNVWGDIFLKSNIPLKWVFFSFSILVLSAGSTGYGYYEGVQNNAPDAELIAQDKNLEHYRNEIKRLSKANSKLEANKDKNGTTFYKLYGSINENTKAITNYSKLATEIEQEMRGKNGLLSKDHKSKVEFISLLLLILVLISEVGYESCISYQHYFKKKCLACPYAATKKSSVRKNPQTRIKYNDESLKRLVDDSTDSRNEASRDSFIGRLNNSSPTPKINYLTAKNGVKYVIERGEFYAINMKSDGTFTKHDIKSIQSNIRTNKSKLRNGNGSEDVILTNLDKWQNYRRTLLELS